MWPGFAGQAGDLGYGGEWYCCASRLLACRIPSLAQPRSVREKPSLLLSQAPMSSTMVVSEGQTSEQGIQEIFSSSSQLP